MSDDHKSIRVNSRANWELARQGVAAIGNRLNEGWTLILTRKRSAIQNARMWAILGQIVKARPEHHGMSVTADDYKTLFVHALRKEMRLIPDLDGQGVVPLGYSSSALSVSEFSDLFELMAAWCAREGITIRDPKDRDAAQSG
jgi:hypothetical protein